MFTKRHTLTAVAVAAVVAASVAVFTVGAPDEHQDAGAEHSIEHATDVDQLNHTDTREDDDLVDGQPRGAGAGPGPYVDRVRKATGEPVTIADAVQMSRTLCSIHLSLEDEGAADPRAELVDYLANVPGAPAGAPEVVVDAALRFGCPEKL